MVRIFVGTSEVEDKFIEREPGSGEHNALLRRLDLRSKTRKNANLLGFIDKNSKIVRN